MDVRKMIEAAEGKLPAQERKPPVRLTEGSLGQPLGDYCEGIARELAANLRRIFQHQADKNPNLVFPARGTHVQIYTTSDNEVWIEIHFSTSLEAFDGKEGTLDAGALYREFPLIYDALAETMIKDGGWDFEGVVRTHKGTWAIATLRTYPDIVKKMIPF